MPTNPYYQYTGTIAYGSAAKSSAINTDFAAVQAGFDAVSAAITSTNATVSSVSTTANTAASNAASALTAANSAETSITGMQTTWTMTGAFSAGSVAVTGSTAPNTGLYQPVSNELGVMVGAQQRLLFDGSGNLFSRGISLCKYKGTSTPRSSLTTPTNDGDLQLSLAAGTYEYECVAVIYAASSNGGLACNMNFSGTFSNGLLCIADGTASSTGALNGPYLVALDTSSLSINYSSGTLVANTTTYLRYKGTLTVTAAGTLAFAWSQNSSNAVATSVYAGSYLKVTQLS